MRLFSKTTLTTACALATLAVGVAAIADHHKADHHENGGKKSADGLEWFDAMNCTICEPMAESGMMTSMKWEAHKIDNGMVMVAVVPEAQLDKYRDLCVKMHAVAAKVGAGYVKDAKCCGFCEAFGGVIGEGAKLQEIETEFGAITIVTATDDATVAKIHAMADRTLDEMKKLAAAG